MVAAVKKLIELPNAKLIVAFASVYVIWGSTYLAIYFAIESIPTFMMGGIRFMVAGLLLYIYLRMNGRPKPSFAEWKTEAIVGFLLLSVANGSLVMAEHTVPSGLSALIIASIPLWMVLLNWLWKEGARPNAGVTAGLALGLIGLVTLVGPDSFSFGGALDPFGIFLLFFASFTWAIGSIYSKGAIHPKSPMLSAAMQMIAGSVFLFIFSSINNEWTNLDISAFTEKSWLALLYLITFGSIAGYGSYVYILRHSTPDHVSTYAYVNPVIAVFLGWVFAGEIVDIRIIAAAFLIIFSVVLITKYREKATPIQEESLEEEVEPLNVLDDSKS